MLLHTFARLDHLLHRLARQLGEAWRRRRSDTGAMTTLEMVLLGVGIAAIATLFLGTMREVVTSRLNELK